MSGAVRSIRAKSPGPPNPAASVRMSVRPAGGSAAGSAAAGGSAVVPHALAFPELSTYRAFVLYFILMACAVNVNQGDKWQLFVSACMAFGALETARFLDPAKPEYKQQMLCAFLAVSAAFYWYSTVPHFATVLDFIEKLVKQIPDLDKMFGACVGMFADLNAENGMGIPKHILEHATITAKIDALLAK